jgi:hypothetical protein
MNHGRRRDHRWPPVWWRAQYVAMTQTREYRQGKALSIRHQRRQVGPDGAVEARSGQSTKERISHHGND